MASFLLFILVNSVSFFWLIGSEAEEFFLHEFLIFGTVFFLVVGVQCLIVWSLYVPLQRMMGRSSKHVAHVVLFALTVVNAYVSCFGEFHTADKYRWLLAALPGVLLLAGVQTAPLRRGISLFSLILIAMSLYSYVGERIGMANAKLTSSSTTASFQNRPNVYAVSFESLLSPHALKRFYDASDPGHFDYLRKRGFRVLDDAYSAGSATIASLSRILEYDTDLRRTEQMRAVFGSENTTYRILRENGYQINFMYAKNYLGTNRGGADYFFPVRSFSTCHFLSEDYLYFACKRDFASWINKKLFGGTSYLSVEQHIELIKDRVDAIKNGNGPGFIFTHINFPGHTLLNHDYRDSEAIASFAGLTRERIPQIKRYFEAVFDHIVENDPDAVILVYGDHGAWISRGMTASEAGDGNTIFSFKDMLLDRHGAALAIYPRNFCEERIREGASTLLLMDNLFACLSGQTEMTEAEHQARQQIFHGGKRRALKSLLDLPQ